MFALAGLSIRLTLIYYANFIIIIVRDGPIQKVCQSYDMTRYVSLIRIDFWKIERYEPKFLLLSSGIFTVRGAEEGLDKEFLE